MVVYCICMFVLSETNGIIDRHAAIMSDASNYGTRNVFNDLHMLRLDLTGIPDNGILRCVRRSKEARHSTSSRIARSGIHYHEERLHFIKKDIGDSVVYVEVKRQRMRRVTLCALRNVL